MNTGKKFIKKFSEYLHPHFGIECPQHLIPIATHTIHGTLMGQLEAKNDNNPTSAATKETT